jgi:hypothetical protein
MDSHIKEAKEIKLSWSGARVLVKCYFEDVTAIAMTACPGDQFMMMSEVKPAVSSVFGFK